MTQMGTSIINSIWLEFQSQGALSTVSYRSITAGSVTATGLTDGALGATTTTTGIQAIIGTFKTQEIDGVRVQRGDRRLRFPTSILSVTPTVNDQAVIGTTTYRVINVMQPVDGASWDLQIRNP